MLLYVLMSDHEIPQRNAKYAYLCATLLTRFDVMPTINSQDELTMMGTRSI